MSRAYVCAFIATITSYSRARDTKPVLLMRISYHVGRPWMFDGKRFFPDTGTPMRNIARMIRLFALEDPVPLTLASFRAKSLTRSSRAGATSSAMSGHGDRRHAQRQRQGELEL